MDLTAKAEQSLIGSILLSPDKLVHISSIVSAEDFTCDNAKRSYLIALSLWKDKKQVSLTTVAMRDVSLSGYLSSAISEGCAIAIKQQASTVALQAKERRIKKTLSEIINDKGPVNSKLDDILALYRQEMYITAKNPEISEVIKRVDERVAENKKRGRIGTPTGFELYDDIYMQYVPGHVWLMGAFTSVGKTAFMVQKICNLLVQPENHSIIVVSVEMSEEAIVARILQNFTGIPYYRILSGRYYQGEEEVICEYRNLLKSKPLKIYEDVYELSEIETVFQKASLQGGVAVGFIDYVQNCTVRGASNVYQKTEALSKGLQKLAKDVRCTLVLLSQVSNSVGRGDIEQLEYKGGGEWAAIADIGIMLRRHKTDKYKVLYSIDKNRHGPVGKYQFEYKQDYARLEYICKD